MTICTSDYTLFNLSEDLGPGAVGVDHNRNVGPPLFIPLVVELQAQNRPIWVILVRLAKPGMMPSGTRKPINNVFGITG